MKRLSLLLALLLSTAAWSAEDGLTEQGINEAAFVPPRPVAEASGSNPEEADKKPDPALVRVQVLLDRAHASPGVIDGYEGENLTKAVRAYEEMRGFAVDGRIDQEVWDALTRDQRPAVVAYAITKEDLDEKFVKSIPEDYAEMAEMKRLGFRGPAEMLAERFHMDEDLIKALNPDADFSKPGTEILVADPAAEPTAKVTRVVVDKSDGDLRAFDEAGKLVAAYPATIGSQDNPSPEGELMVERVVRDPGYTYNPEKNFQQGDNDEVLDIPPGPNGPVGSIWIDLSKPTYGIHGTPEPSKIDKSPSHGCVRLTNWDAASLGEMVEPKKTVVVFQG